MNKLIKIIISSLLIILWCSLIFFMSNMDSTESNDKSKSTINKTIESTIDITNDTGITDVHLNENEMKQLTNKLNKPIRKCAHATEYLILCMLILNLIFIIKNKRKFIYFVIAIIACAIYAITDEYHQTFISGRTGQYMDVMIDTMGSALGCLVFMIIYKIKNKFKNIPKINKKVLHS